jgi:antitoxin CptB
MTSDTAPVDTHRAAPPRAVPASAPGAAIADPARLARLRWRCRRGMLENDLLLARFLDARGAALTEAEVALLDALLDLPDTELWDLLAGRKAPADPALAPLVAALASSPQPEAPMTRGMP